MDGYRTLSSLSIKEFTTNILVFVKLKTNSTTDLNNYFKVMTYPLDSSKCLDGLISFWNEDYKTIIKEIYSIKNVR